jgi:transcriptional/translational regulatory protein YebC/TACO1
MQNKLEEMKIDVENAELHRIPNNTKQLELESSKKVLRMIDSFEEDEDVQNIFHNLEMTEDLVNELQ